MIFYVETINSSCNDGPTSLITQTLPIDPKERRRQREREQYAQMNSTKREELLKRHRESHKKQNPSTWNKENEVPAEDSEWLRRNDNY
jgi:hypothetical protein